MTVKCKQKVLALQTKGFIKTSDFKSKLNNYQMLSQVFMLSIQYQVFTGYKVFCIAVYDIPQGPNDVIICLHCVQCSKS